MKSIRAEKIKRKMTLDFNGGNWNMENDKVKSLIDMMKINFYNFVEIYFCLC